MDYILVMLLKQNSIEGRQRGDTNEYRLFTLPCDWKMADIFLDNLVLQGHDLKNVALYNPESYSLRTYEPQEQYGYHNALEVKQVSKKDISFTVEYFKGFFNIYDTVHRY